jgi:transcriptional regulator with XRE-family HTH domain
MAPKQRKKLQSIGERLKSIRNHHNFSLSNMFSHLGVTRDTYYKNEKGETLPGLSSLEILHRNFDISMDWFLFNSGPMNFSEKIHQKESPIFKENFSSEISDMITTMEKEPILMHEMLTLFYKYKKENAIK